MSRYFEFKDEKSNKFWSVSSSDKKMSIHYGKIGTAGQKLDKEFESAEEAVKETEKAISKKLKEWQSIPRRQETGDIVGAFVFLASADSDFTTGQTFNIDGGWMMH